jgi:hypothetical protein
MLREQTDAARVQRVQEKERTEGKCSRLLLSGFSIYQNLSSFPCSELKKVVADETAVKEAIQVAFTSVQEDLKDLEGAIVAVCQELEVGEALLGAWWPVACDRWAVGWPSVSGAPSASAFNGPWPWRRCTMT